MERNYTNVVFDPMSAHYVGAASITVPFQEYDEEGEIQLGPEGKNTLMITNTKADRIVATNEMLPPATNERSTLELFSAGSDSWRVIDG